MTRYILFFFLLSTGPLWGQGLLQKEADKAVQDLDYVTAILLYQQALERDLDNTDIKIGLADCYRQVNDTENAERWYAEIVRSKQAKPIHQLYYGMMLQANGKCDKAKFWFEQYTAAKPDDARGQHLAKSCGAVSWLSKAGEGIYKVIKMPFNSNADDFAPTIHGNKLIFSSDRDQGGPVRRTSMWTGSPFAELYALHFEPRGESPTDFLFENPQKFGKGINTKYHEAAVSFSPDGQTIFFTRNNFLNGKTGKSEDGLVKLKIYTGAADEPESWSRLQELPFCSNEYSTAHPSISADGKRLFFASNKPGGYGGMDLYISEWEDGRWGSPTNLGPEINTEGNEIYPFVDANGRLYFASNSHVGLGGLDLYYASPKGQGDWNAPINLGAPVNSTHDDFGIGFAPDGSWGVFTSDRPGGAGRDDLYAFTKKAVAVEVYVSDYYKKTPLKSIAMVNKQSGLTMFTGADGKLGFDMRPEDCAEWVFEKKGYDAVLKQACAKNIAPGEVLKIEVALQKTSDFALQGIVFDMNSGMPAPNVQLTLNNDCERPVEVVLTGPDGRYRFQLNKNCCYTLKANLEGFLPDISENNCTDNLAAGQNLRVDLNLLPIPNKPGVATPTPKPTGPVFNPQTGKYENPDGSPANFDLGDGIKVKNGLLFDNGVPSSPKTDGWVRGSSGFLLNVYYDTRESVAQDASGPSLEKLYKMLKDNPDIKVEISAHTDSRGTEEFNKTLSQKRAQSVVDWLSKQGIDPARLRAVGYGESQPVNGCTDNVPCTEEQYQQNRRTEFAITAGPNTDSAKPGEKPKAPCVGCPF
jgi:outer membrane protein OmpA-like peptidoglycan-associated protein